MDDIAPTMNEVQTPRVVIEVLTSSLAGKRYAYSDKDLRRGVMIGRAPDCAIQFDAGRDVKVSGHHALIEIRDGDIYVRDQGSSNGLYVEGQRVDRAGYRLYDNDQISLGQEGAYLRVRIDGEKTRPEESTPSSLGEKGSLTRVINEAGKKYGAGDKTRHMVKEVAEQIEQRQARSRGSLMTLVLALFMLIGACVAIGVWYYDYNETIQAEKTSEKEKELDAKIAQLDLLSEEIQKRQEQQYKDISKQFGSNTADQIKKIQEESNKSLEELRDELKKEKEERAAEIERLVEEARADGRDVSAPSEEVFRELTQKYNKSVLLIWIKFPLLNKDDKIVGYGSGAGTGWVAKTTNDKAYVVTNKHVIKPFLFKSDLAISYAIQNVRPAPMDQWIIAAWAPGAKLRNKAGSNLVLLNTAWATRAGGIKGGKGGLKYLGQADDEMFSLGINTNKHLTAAGFKTDLPEDVLNRVKAIDIHKLTTDRDLAVLELERNSQDDLAVALPMATDQELNDLTQLDPVLTMGYPLGMSVIKGTTVTTSPSTGVIRNVQREESIHLIGFSAPIMPGNSGGPLINRDGKVIGVNSRQFKDSLSEAISIEFARRLLDKLAP